MHDWATKRGAPGAIAAIVLLSAGAGPGCLDARDLPCPSGGAACPTGEACVEGTCRAVGSDGAVAVLRVSLDPAVAASSVGAVVVEGFGDPGVRCIVGRDPDEATNARLAAGELAPEVYGRVSLEEPTEVPVPAGRHVLFVHARSSADSSLIALGCRTREFRPGERVDVWVTLRRANGSCGDSVLDVWEECDDGPEGSPSCSTSCRSRAVEIASGGCYESPAIACTAERCLVGWVRDEQQVVVDVRLFDGRRDEGGTRGIDLERPGAAGLRLGAGERQAAAVWREGSEGLAGSTFDHLGVPTGSLEVAGDASNGRVTLLELARGEGDALVPVAGWIDEAGGVVIERLDEPGSRWEGATGAQLTADAVGALWGSRVFLAWGAESFPPADTDEAVVGLWATLGDGGVEAAEPFLVATSPFQAQTQPALAVLGGEQVLVAWTDAYPASIDRDGTGIRARSLRPGGPGEEAELNTVSPGDQQRVSLYARDYARDGYVVATWVQGDTGELRARYVDGAGRGLEVPFDQGQSTEFVVASGPVAGRAVSAQAVQGGQVYFLWLQEPCGRGGGRRVLLRPLPAPIR